MDTTDSIYREIKLIPEIYLEEVLDFIHFKKGKASKERIGAAILSESALAKDWLSPEENETWADL